MGSVSRPAGRPPARDAAIVELARLAFLLADLPVEVLGRLRSDRVFRLPAPPRLVGAIGQLVKHDGEFCSADPEPGRLRTWSPAPIPAATAARLQRLGIGCITRDGAATLQDHDHHTPNMIIHIGPDAEAGVRLDSPTSCQSHFVLTPRREGFQASDSVQMGKGLSRVRARK